MKLPSDMRGVTQPVEMVFLLSGIVVMTVPSLGQTATVDDVMQGTEELAS